jgi:polyribonucleotide nucleotidyltransferase
MNLVVVGTIDAITMVEAAMKEVPEEKVLEALEIAHKKIKEICEFQLKYVEQFEIEKIEPEIKEKSEEAEAAVTAFVTEEMLNTVTGKSKKEVKKAIHAIEEKLFENYTADIEEEKFSKGELADILNSHMEKNMRKNILEKEERIDGRGLTDVRPISVALDVLPCTHGSAIFQRGETMAISITTLGGPGDAQVVDTMEADITKRYFHHYNFPPFSVGDIRPLRGPGRREIGHGDLAERALIPVLPDAADFPYTMWVMSEITKCNGSSSMASVCGSTLSLMATGVPIKRPVSGIAMGLVMDKESGNYKILTDIQGMEDFAGDMDFKVTGTSEGITALQMDIKVKGLSIDLLREALGQAKEGRNFIMDKMLEAIPEPRKELSDRAPMILAHKIDPDKIGMVIGKGGETIQAITKECEVEIDINDDGIITITAPDQEKGNKALKWIEQITYEPEVGEVFDGKVVKIMEFGAFVQIMPGKDGLVHISELSKERVNKVEDVVKEGDILKVKLIKVDDKGRYSLSHKATLGDQGSAPTKGTTPESHSSHSPDSKKPEAQVGKGGTGELVEGTSAVRKVNG